MTENGQHDSQSSKPPTATSWRIERPLRLLERGDMVQLKPEDTKQVKGMTLRRDPLREECFQVVHSDAEMHEWPGTSPTPMREQPHRHMNNETGPIGRHARCPAGFP